MAKRTEGMLLPNLRKARAVSGNNMATFKFILLVLTISLMSCSQDKKLTILTPRADNLEIGSKVFFRGVEIGKVTKLSIAKRAVAVDIKFMDTIQIPFDSKFIISHPLFLPAEIHITPTDNTRYLTTKDTVVTQPNDKSFLETLVPDSIKRQTMEQSLKKIAEGISEIAESSKDSTTNE